MTCVNILIFAGTGEVSKIGKIGSLGVGVKRVNEEGWL
jgi:hypothetical protein